MHISFSKYQGTGNDFILIDDRENRFDENDHELIEKLCDRRFGIGADGLILLRNHPTTDFEMVYFNADGHTSSMCGNGGRCTVMFAHHLGVIEDKATFMAIDGIHEAKIEGAIVHLKMQEVKEIEKGEGYYYLDTGSPHFVTLASGLSTFDVVEKAKVIRYNDRFAEKGTNVNFIELEAPDCLSIRTYERGVEDETYSCGTGAVAAAIVANQEGLNSPIQLKTMGGALSVSFEHEYDHYHSIYLIGPAEFVFAGEIDLS